MLRNILGNISGASLPAIDSKEPSVTATKPSPPPSPARVVDKAAEITRFIAAFHTNVSVDASQFNAGDLRKMVSAARQNGVLIALRNIKLNGTALGSVIGNDGKSVIVEM